MFTKALLGFWLMCCATVATAQDIQMDLLADGALIIGVVSNADGSPAADTAVQIALSAQPQLPVAILQTDVVGIFTYAGIGNTGYRVTVGSTSADITVGAAPAEPFTWPPIYITLGILLLLSLIPARMLRTSDVT